MTLEVNRKCWLATTVAKWRRGKKNETNGKESDENYDWDVKER